MEPMHFLSLNHNSRKVTHNIPHGATPILLYGGPGTGKTVTTLYAAEHLRRPLMCLSLSELGPTADDAGSRLNVFSKRAQRWDAIIMIEDVDTIFGRQSMSDPIRKIIAMKCLQVLDNYDGILFLTITTLPRGIDESLQLRIGLAIEYRDLGEMECAEIWRNIINDSLYNDKTAISDYSLGEYCFRQTHRHGLHPLNGKQIQIVFKVAMQIAQGASNKWNGVVKYFMDAVESKTKMLKDFTA